MKDKGGSGDADIAYYSLSTGPADHPERLPSPGRPHCKDDRSGMDARPVFERSGFMASMYALKVHMSKPGSRSARCGTYPRPEAGRGLFRVSAKIFFQYPAASHCKKCQKIAISELLV